MPLRKPSRPCSGRGALGVGGLAFRAADGTEEDGVGGLGGLHTLIGEGDAVGVD